MTVVIYINQVPILSRSCHRVKTGQMANVYKVDDGRTIVHKGEDGAVKLSDYKVLLTEYERLKDWADKHKCSRYREPEA